ncbi:MAG: ATP-binding cassette domain-containing protein [Alphaproteobacteria bacterium]|nr:ATP-binding cassette domain-containing protein [Alphaproteobacteria bacterium]
MTDAAIEDELLYSFEEMEDESGQLSGAASVWRDPSQTGWFTNSSDISACLSPLLQALGLAFNEAQIFEALPHFTEDLDIDGFRNTLANLQFESSSVSIQLADLDPRALPVLYVPNNGSAMVVLFFTGDEALVFDGGAQENRRIKTVNIDGDAYFFRHLEQSEISSRANYRDWFPALVNRFRPILTLGLGLTLLINLISLGIPLFVMAIYDSVLGTESVSMLMHLVAGAILTVGADFTLRRFRTRAVSYFGARIDNLVGNEVFRRMLYMPPVFTERATISSQVARIKDFDGIRDFVTGPQALVLFELPFTFIFLAAITLLAGPVVFIPIFMIVLFGIMFWLLHGRVSRAVAKSARAAAERQEFVVEAMNNLRSLKYTNSTKIWMDRFRASSSKATLAGFETARINAFVSAISHFIMMSAGIATVAFGAFGVVEGSMSVGALIATMILVWRSLGPLQLAFVALPRLAQIRSGTRQIDAMMRLPQERGREDFVPLAPTVVGHIQFSRINFRYAPDSDPVLWNIDFTAKPGEIIALVGNNGCGKSTIVRLLMALHRPQSGGILIDGRDIRQFDAIELRRLIGYVPQTPRFFYGTIAQNLRLTKPAASDEDLRKAARDAYVLDEIEALPEGFETRIGDGKNNKLPGSVMQRLNIARCYLKDAPIVILDEPGNALDFDADQAVMETIHGMRGHKTVLLITHRPSHMRLADKLVTIDRGRIHEIVEQTPSPTVANDGGPR